MLYYTVASARAKNAYEAAFSSTRQVQSRAVTRHDKAAYRVRLCDSVRLAPPPSWCVGCDQRAPRRAVIDTAPCMQPSMISIRITPTGHTRDITEDDTRRMISYQLLQLQFLVLDEFAATQLRKHLAYSMLTSSQSARAMHDD